MRTTYYVAPRMYATAPVRCHTEFNPAYIGLYSVIFECYGRMIGAAWGVMDDFGNFVEVL